jgi:hypothetical protein
MSTALVIGNGPSNLDYELGNLIDSDKWDIVVRFNRWEKDDDGNKHGDYSKYIGTRCDYWVLNDLHLKKAFTYYNDYSYFLIVCPLFKFSQYPVKDIESKYEKIKFIPAEYEQHVNNNIIDFNNKWPSSGIITLLFIANHFDNVYYHGFDIYNTNQDKLHYFEDRLNWNQVNKHADKNGHGGHIPEKERFLFNHLTKNYSLKKL